MFFPDSEVLPCTDLEEHYIDTGDASPIYIPPYRCSKAEEEVIQKEVDDMLACIGCDSGKYKPLGCECSVGDQKNG